MPQSSLPGPCIQLCGVEQNNLKNIDVKIPLHRLTVITGVSGSGKSSLAFDTLYAEGQRRYVESLSAYARQFLERLRKPRLREAHGLSPAIAIRQKSSARNPRSTVGTVTEIYDYLRLLYARAGTIRCRNCSETVGRTSIDEAVERLRELPQGTRLYLSFPFRGSLLDLNSDHPGGKVPLQVMLENLLKQGFGRLLAETGRAPTVLNLPQEAPTKLAELEASRVLVDRVVAGRVSRERLVDSLEICYLEGNGVALVTALEPGSEPGPQEWRFSERFECPACNLPYRPPEPRLFSFNSPYGACPRCQGFGNTVGLDSELIIPERERSLAQGAVEPFRKPRYRRFQKELEEWARRQRIPLDLPYGQLSREVQERVWKGEEGFPGIEGFFRYLERKKYKMHVRIFISRYRSYTVCPECGGERLCQDARDVYLDTLSIGQLTAQPIHTTLEFLASLELPPGRRQVAERVLQEVLQRLRFLVEVGLDYLTLDRLTSTLSGGELQRIHLAASLGSSLVGTLYILDEPSIGLHPRDESRLIGILKRLRDLGNTVVVVEHEREMIQSADHVIDLGPGAGELGGRVIHSGSAQALRQNRDSLTGGYLGGRLRLATPVFRRSASAKVLTLRGVRQHNLKDLTVRLPLGILVCITGVSGSGKSTLVHDVLYAGIKRRQGEWKGPAEECDSIEGWKSLGQVLLVDQSPIGRTPRSNPVTYIKAFDEVRRLFASLREAQSANLGPSHFSFNVPGGRCETCQGAGVVTVEMQFLADVELECEDCRGKRFSNRILEITYKGKNIAEVLEMTVSEALAFFQASPRLVRKLRVLEEVGLGYLRLGQSATTLSGGEAQRVKLASYLSRRSLSGALFLFDEPTTGLHFDDISKLLKAFDRLISHGSSVIVIEHNLDVIKYADWILDLGPEGGEKGGQIVVEGPPEQVAAHPASHTGHFLKDYL